MRSKTAPDYTISKSEDVIISPSPSQQYEKSDLVIIQQLLCQNCDQQKRIKSQSFTLFEDLTLKILVQSTESKRINWPILTSDFNEIIKSTQPRKTAQIYQRWHRVLNPEIRKGQWTAEEDQKVIDLLNLNPRLNYSQIAQRLGDRSDIQVRYRLTSKIDDWVRKGLLPQNLISSIQ